MKEIARGRTVFVIAHRLSTVRNSDRIVTLERGRLVEDGTHDQLIHSNGRYDKAPLLAGWNSMTAVEKKVIPFPQPPCSPARL
jgi:subfamily B ATP-binding cassette protein HlyB/CyaB